MEGNVIKFPERKIERLPADVLWQAFNTAYPLFEPRGFPIEEYVAEFSDKDMIDVDAHRTRMMSWKDTDLVQFVEGETFLEDSHKAAAALLLLRQRAVARSLQ